MEALLTWLPLLNLVAIPVVRVLWSQALRMERLEAQLKGIVDELDRHSRRMGLMDQ